MTVTAPRVGRTSPPRLILGAFCAVLAGVALPLAVAAPAGAAPGPAPRPVAIVLVPDLMWSTVPSSVDRFAKASLSMRTAEAGSRAADVYLTLGKGGRSAALESGDVGRVERLPDGGLRLLDWRELELRDSKLRLGGALGSVGEALAQGGRRWVLVTDDMTAAAVAATSSGTVPVAYEGTPGGLQRALDDDPDGILLTVARTALPQALQSLEGVCTLLVSASTPMENRHLGVFAASPTCGLGTGGLRSPSTHHAHLATLPDVSQTFLELVGVRPSRSMDGAAVARAADIGRQSLVERDRRTWTADRSRTPLVWLFVALHALGAVIVVRRPEARLAVCCALLAIPTASFLMMLAPWWKSGAAVGVLVGGLIASLVGLGGALLVRRDLVTGVGVLAGLVSAVVVVDALFGSPLQIDAPFGNSPVVAGRFFGVGNIGSGFLVAGLLLAAGLVIDRWGRRSLPWVSMAFAVGAIAGGAPQFGADVGGVLFAIPAFGLLLVGVVRDRFRARHLLFLAGAPVAAVVLFAIVDMARGPDAQTHLARTLGADGLGDELVRKATRAVQTVRAPMASVVPIAIAALALTRYSPGPRPTIRFTSYAVVVAAVLGSLLNDSGVIVAAAVLAVAWPAGVLFSSPSRQAPLPPGGVPA